MVSKAELGTSQSLSQNKLPAGILLFKGFQMNFFGNFLRKGTRKEVPKSFCSRALSWDTL